MGVRGGLRVMAAGILFVSAGTFWSQIPSPSPPEQVSRVWSPDLGNGRYKNPVLYADYSDPDVLRVGDDFYLVASSFNMTSALPILHSRDLVNWEIVAHVFTQQEPTERFKTPQHGGGVWAPSLRHHKGEFYLFYPDPDVGIYMTKAKTIEGRWSKPILVKAAPGWIDPCPFWDDDGKAYLVNAAAGSRRGVKSLLMISRMATDGTHLLDDASILVDGHDVDPTLEGPKIYKRRGWYYLFAPAGGVTNGWQVVFRSHNIYGPYERRVVLRQGSTKINGPHQGTWIRTAFGEDWFLHFQDQGPYGRVVHLEPMRWEDDWPLMGTAVEGASIGEPVAGYRKPRVRTRSAAMMPADSDEFNSSQLGLQWQWQANPEPSWAFPSKALGVLRLICVPSPDAGGNLWRTPNVLTQKFPGPEFSVTTKLIFHSHAPGDETGLVVMGQSYASLTVRGSASGLELLLVERAQAEADGAPKFSSIVPLSRDTVYLRATVLAKGMTTFSYSVDGKEFTRIGETFAAEPGRWIGATIGLYATAVSAHGELGYGDYDWFRFDRP